jgi:hypothetical protein
MAKTLIHRHTYEVTVESENKSQCKEPVIQPRMGIVSTFWALQLAKVAFLLFTRKILGSIFRPRIPRRFPRPLGKCWDISLKQATTASLRVFLTSLPTLILPF